MKLFWFVSIFAGVPLAAGTIEGRVTNSVTGAGIGGVQVTAQTPGPPIPPVTTDDGGLFRIPDAPDGPYTFSYSKEGYYPARVAGPAPVIRVSGDAHVDLRMIPRASLQGRVLDPEGKPAPGITVTLDSFGMSAITDEDGAFKIENLKPGTSRLSAKPKSQSQAQPKNVERTVTTYYPSIIDSTQAAWIQVQGIDLFGYDIRLQAAHATLTLLRPAYRRAVFVDGLVRSLEPRAQTGGRSETADDGSFEFPAVLEGDWTLRANLGSDNQRSGAAELRIGRDDLDKVVISLAGPFYVTASPDWGDSTPPVKPRLLTSVAILLPLDGQANGKIEIGKSPSRSAAFAGQYLISGTTSAESGFYLAAIMMDNRDVLGQIVNLQGPAALTMVYKKGGGSVRGTADGGAGATVVLMADGPSAARFGWSAKCDANGNVSFANLPPGNYTAAVFSGAPDLDDSQLEPLLSGRGERVKVEDGAVATTDLHTNRRWVNGASQ